MAIWLVRAGSQGQYEQKFLQEKKIYLTWDELNVRLDTLVSREELIHVLEEKYPDAKYRKQTNHASQIWPFAHAMEKGDRVILPSKPSR